MLLHQGSHWYLGGQSDLYSCKIVPCCRSWTQMLLQLGCRGGQGVGGTLVNRPVVQKRSGACRRTGRFPSLKSIEKSL